MFNVGGGELLVVLLLALVFLGPDRLPDIAKKVGRFMGEARRMTSGFQEEIRSAMDATGANDAVHRAEPGSPMIGAPPDTPEPTAEPSANIGPVEADAPLGSGDTGADESGRGDTSAA